MRRYRGKALHGGFWGYVVLVAELLLGGNEGTPMIRRAIAAVCILWVAVAGNNACAQTFSRDVRISIRLHGRVVADSGSVDPTLIVDLRGTGVNDAGQAFLDSRGEFDFYGVTPGYYTARVLDRSGNVLAEQMVTAGDNFDCVIRLSSRRQAKPGAGSISVAELMHKVPKEAMREYQKGLSAISRKDFTNGIVRLQNAVNLDQNFLQAQVDLGKCYLNLGKSHEAIATFDQVLKINPKSEIAHAGRGLSFLWLGDYPSAERSARMALQIDTGSMVSQYVLGMSLAAQEKSDEEALLQLRKASNGIPNAHLAAAQIYQREGKPSEVKTELEDYLKSGNDATVRNKVKGWLNSLSQQE